MLRVSTQHYLEHRIYKKNSLCVSFWLSWASSLPLYTMTVIYLQIGQQCPHGFYRGPGNDICVQSKEFTNTTSQVSDDADACLCVAGYWAGLHGAECEACPINTYKPMLGMQKCEKCPAHSSASKLQQPLLAFPPVFVCPGTYTQAMAAVTAYAQRASKQMTIMMQLAQGVLLTSTKLCLGTKSAHCVLHIPLLCFITALLSQTASARWAMFGTQQHSSATSALQANSTMRLN
jgi:hypothetical protein